jgi:riboflavin synthase
MFTGIIEEIGTVLQCEPTGLVIQAAQVLQGIETKDSIAVDGACLTVTGRGEDWFRVDVMPETFRCTRPGRQQSGSHVNLERALLSGGRIGGHLVQGHVEATAHVLSIQEDGIAHLVEIELPEQLRPFVIPKGFIAVNGVSLTVIERLQSSFSLALIPYTKQHTNLGEIQPGTLLNLETDIVGRYVVHLLTLTGEEAPGSGNERGETAIRDIASAALASLQERGKLPISPLAW